MATFTHRCTYAGIILSLLYGHAACLAQSSVKPTGVKSSSQMRLAANLLPDAPSHQTQSMDDALAAFRHQLARDHKQEFSSLLTKQVVLRAINSAQQGYEANQIMLRAALGQSYQKNIGLMQQITKGGPWPKGAYFSAFYQLQDAKGITYQGLGVRLVVMDPQHPGHELLGSSWPIVDTWYGRIE